MNLRTKVQLPFTRHLLDGQKKWCGGDEEDIKFRINRNKTQHSHMLSDFERTCVKKKKGITLIANYQFNKPPHTTTTTTTQQNWQVTDNMQLILLVTNNEQKHKTMGEIMNNSVAVLSRSLDIDICRYLACRHRLLAHDNSAEPCHSLGPWPD